MTDADRGAKVVAVLEHLEQVGALGFGHGRQAEVVDHEQVGAGRGGDSTGQQQRPVEIAYHALVLMDRSGALTRLRAAARACEPPR